jgi:hypothetical protein
MAKHVVKHYYLVEGESRIIAHQFDSYEEAFLHAELSNAQTVQLYSPSGELLIERQSTETSSEDNNSDTII